MWIHFERNNTLLMKKSKYTLLMAIILYASDKGFTFYSYIINILGTAFGKFAQK